MIINIIRQNERHRNMFYLKKVKTSKKYLNETEISYLPDKEFRVIVTKLFTKLRSTDECSANIKKEIENKRKYQTEVTELKKKNTVN